MSFPQISVSAHEFPSSILGMMDIEIPDRLPAPNADLIERFNPRAVVIISIDNFGLFEAVVYKPEFIIKKLEVLALLDTPDPYAVPLIRSLLRGPAFHLIDYVQQYGKFVRVICRGDDMDTFGFDPGYTIPTRDDMTSYIEATRHVFKSELMFVHFLDFESLYAQYGHQTPPEKLLSKIVKRADNWIKVLYRQSRIGTLFVVVGNHGRHPVPLNYEGKLAEWRKANAPIAIMFQKHEELSE
ncbi:MAG: hypothetical protein K9W43_09655 [Candidatus Thorarchaeota archaeon]|nr:hypothetical protein [Candidatus Thorarchaeota archaeon]